MSDIEQILYPTVLTNLREDVPPVKCIIWKGGDDYDIIEFDKVYPFDTIEDIKRMICTYYERDPKFIPKFVFVGIPIGDIAYSEENPSLNIQYLAADYLWYPTGTNDPQKTYILANPRKTLTVPDMRFVVADGSYSSPNYEPRGRSTIETVFLKPRDGKIPVFHVFTLNHLLREYKGTRPIGEEDWNKRFAPYFPNVPLDGPYEPDADDIRFAKKIHIFIKQRDRTLEILNGLLEGGYEVPNLKVTGIRQLRLVWNKPVKGFEGSGYIFYRIPVTDLRPFLRLLPAEGSGITKLHVKGVLPIPTLDDPRVLEIWGKETTPTPGTDYTYFKYIHRPSIGITPAIYGTVRILNDGTMDLLLQPPKNINKLDPILDFKNFSSVLTNIFEGLPQEADNFKIGEIASVFTLKTDIKAKKFTRNRLLQRLPLFQAIFQEINALPNQSPIISLRYKAVNQFATEDKTFSFLTQYATAKILEGEAAEYEMVGALQNEFQMSKAEATEIVSKWFEQRGTFTLALPEEGEFMESFNPGIDIHIYSQHPSYYFHVNRIDSYDTYLRVYAFLSLLFMDDDEYFAGAQQLGDTLSKVSYDIERQDIEEEEQLAQEISPPIQEQAEQHQEQEQKQEEEQEEVTAVNASAQNQLTPENGTANTIPDYLMDMMMNPMNAMNDQEVQPEDAPNPITELTEAKAISDQQPLKRKRPTIATAETTRELPNVNNIEEQDFNNDEDIPVKKGPTLQPLAKNEDEQKLVNPKSWFIKKLQEIDSRLFDYSADNPKDSYSRKCQDVDDRQPSVLTKDQYERMREVYENDNIFFIVYPLEGTTEPIQPLGTEETYTLMRYGSSADDINYYFCPKYFCLSDEIMIRPKDFESTRDRDGNPKPPNTCPFCKGRLITNKKKAELGYTVIRRKDKKNSIHPHTQIDFLSKSSHPEDFALPCCFLKHKTLRISNSEFAHIRDYLQEKDLARLNADELSEETEEEDLETLNTKDETAIEYQVLFETLNKRYILESNKHPDPGIFATAPSEFDRFFAQDSGNTLVKRVGINLKLLPNAQGFLRIGTENTLTESLFGVLAPIIYKNSINEVRERVLEVVSPRIFIFSHFGNLVLEFYNPSDSTAMPQTEQALKAWASKELQVDVNSSNNLALIRVYNAYRRFVRFIRDPTQRKDLRHIQPLLAEPGLFTARGVQLVVLEKDKNGQIQIKCPNFGVSLDRHKRCDFVFISREMRNIGQTDNQYAKYELYLHTINIPARGGEGEVHETTLRWMYSNRAYWPQIIQKRVDEYMNDCQSRYRSIYTSQEGVDSMAMIPLSKAIEASPFYPVGVIRDSYNHAVAITFRSKPGRSTLVALPIVDDGYMPVQLGVHFDWEDFTPAQFEDVVSYYKNTLEPLFALYPGYIIKYAVKTRIENKIVAIQLQNGIYIPCRPPKDDKVLAELGMNVVTIDELEWTIDKEFTKQCGEDQELARKSSYGDFEELYQQFRLMVSNWITDVRAGGEVRKGIENIIFNDNLPEYERRKRLFIFLAPSLLSWFYPDTDKWEQPTTFLRKDCRVIDTKDACSGTCHWNSSEGKCLLHVHAKTELGERKVSTPDLFTKRVVDELVRFPNRRKQLMKKGEVSKVSGIMEPIRQGDQYIIPEASPTWSNLLRLDWTKQIPEKPVYYEEMSRELSSENQIIPEGELPKGLEELLGSSTQFRVKIPDTQEENPLLPFTAILGTSLSDLGLDDDATTMTKENLAKYVRKTSKPIGLIDLRIDTTNPEVQFIKPMAGIFNNVIILVFLPGQYGILIEEDGNPTVTIEKLPEIIQSIWKSSPIVIVKKTRPAVATETPIPPTLIGTNPLRNTRRKRPQLAKTSELVEAQPVEEPIVVPKPRKRPTIAATTTTTNVKETPAIRPSVANVLRSQTRKKRPQIASVSVTPAPAVPALNYRE
jgi:hypothetical protein